MNFDDFNWIFKTKNTWKTNFFTRLEDIVPGSMSDWYRFQLLFERWIFGRKLQQTDGPLNFLISVGNKELHFVIDPNE